MGFGRREPVACCGVLESRIEDTRRRQGVGSRELAVGQNARGLLGVIWSAKREVWWIAAVRANGTSAATFGAHGLCRDCMDASVISFQQTWQSNRHACVALASPVAFVSHAPALA